MDTGLPVHLALAGNRRFSKAKHVLILEDIVQMNLNTSLVKLSLYLSI